MSCNLFLAMIWQKTYTHKMPKLCSATLIRQRKFCHGAKMWYQTLAFLFLRTWNKGKARRTKRRPNKLPRQCRSKVGPNSVRFGAWVEQRLNRVYEECNCYQEIFSLVRALEISRQYLLLRTYIYRESRWVPLPKAKTYNILAYSFITSYPASFNNCQIFHCLSRPEIYVKFLH